MSSKRRMINVKLAKAVEKPEVEFAIGRKRIRVTAQGNPIEDADFKIIQQQLPGWIEPVPSGKAEVQPKTD